MTIKVVKSLKYLALFLSIFFTTTSCEKEIGSTEGNLEKNNNFSIKGEALNVQFNGLVQYLLDAYAGKGFGSLKVSIVTQLILPTLGEPYSEFFGANVAIDSVFGAKKLKIRNIIYGS